MNIPYADFYSGELDNNDFEVDAVTSATTSKWMNYDYTYFAELEDGSGGGTIYGPKYPVYISADLFAELSTLGETEDYYVTALDEEPAAYKEVTGEVGSCGLV